MAAARRKQGRHEETTFLIIDVQSVMNTDTAMEKGYDAGKKVSGIKRHIIDRCGGRDCETSCTVLRYCRSDG